jgi:hypothetical protein
MRKLMSMQSATIASHLPRSRIAGFVGQAETFAGTVMAALLASAVCLFCAFLCAAPAYPEIGKMFRTNGRLLASAGAIGFCIEILSAGLIVRTLQRHPANGLLSLPERQWSFPLLLRPLIAALWFAHFLAMSLAGHWLVVHMRIVLDPTEYQIWMTRIIQFIGLLGVSFSSNAYLVLATGTMFRDRSAVRLVYRIRLLIDLVVVVIVIFLPAPRWVG